MKFQKTLLAAVSALALIVPSVAPGEEKAESETATSSAKDGPKIGSYGFDTEGMDTSVSAGDDFFEYANGAWAKKTEIPDDKSNYGMFTALADLSSQRVKDVLEAEKDSGTKAGNAYKSYIDTDKVEQLGT